jgi:hypothetical protein
MASAESFLVAYTIGVIAVSLPFILLIDRIARVPRRLVRRLGRYVVE